VQVWGEWHEYCTNKMKFASYYYLRVTPALAGGARVRLIRDIRVKKS
jgi:hypothetical protein